MKIQYWEIITEVNRYTKTYFHDYRRPKLEIWKCPVMESQIKQFTHKTQFCTMERPKLSKGVGVYLISICLSLWCIFVSINFKNSQMYVLYTYNYRYLYIYLPRGMQKEVTGISPKVSHEYLHKVLIWMVCFRMPICFTVNKYHLHSSKKKNWYIFYSALLEHSSSSSHYFLQ